MDESGCDNIKKIDNTYPVFNLTGILFHFGSYHKANNRLKKIKNDFWGNEKIIFRSRLIRKKIGDFSILLNQEIEGRFIIAINDFMLNSDFKIFSSIIDLHSFKNKYGKNSFNPYNLTLTFILERIVGYLNIFYKKDTKLTVIIESRGNNSDNTIKHHFNKILLVGTGFITPQQLEVYKMELLFKEKKLNINGLQIADLVAWPITRFKLDNNENKPYLIIKDKIGQYGLKCFP